MSSFLRSVGPLIAKHKATLAEAVGPLLGFAIRLGADDNSSFMQSHMQAYAQANPEVSDKFYKIRAQCYCRKCKSPLILEPLFSANECDLCVSLLYNFNFIVLQNATLCRKLHINVLGVL